MNCSDLWNVEEADSMAFWPGMLYNTLQSASNLRCCCGWVGERMMRRIVSRYAPRKPPLAARVRRAFLYVNAGVLLLCAAGIGLALGALSTVEKFLPDAKHIMRYRPTATTKILAADGTLLGKVYEENREPVPLRDIPKELQWATVAIEDERFFHHVGLDPRGIARAAWENFREGRLVQGGSTITQQLARNIYLTRKKTIARKLQEGMLALQIERSFSKQEILEMYLNQVCYGHGAYGVEAAAQLYFGKSVKDLTLPECALLAGLPRWPVGYSPFDHPKRALARRNTVLRAMARLWPIPREEIQAALKAPLGVRKQPAARGILRFRAPHFTTYVIKLLTDALVKQYGDIGADMLYKGGLTVETTLNPQLQAMAWEECRKAAKRIKAYRADQTALVCVDVHTGEVLALVGAVGPFEQNQFNIATQGRRQPGSAFKLFVYTAAIDSGWGPNSYVSGVPRTFYIGPGQRWTPKNYSSRQNHGWTFRSALAQSVNVAAANVIDKVGVRRVITYAHRMGIESPIGEYYSIALGTEAVTLLELTSAYATVASGGIRHPPVFIRRVTDMAGNEIPLPIKHPPARVLNRRTAVTMIDMLQSVVRSGTGRPARIPGVPVGGKTGTTEDKRDAWFIGITPDLAVGVWAGNKDNSPMRGHAYGSRLCAPTWKAFTKRAIETLNLHGEFPRDRLVVARQSMPKEPEENEDEQEQPRILVTICTESGLRATKYCPSTRTERFIKGEEPLGFCTLHGRTSRRRKPKATGKETGGPPKSAQMVRVTVCTESGKRATPYCPSTETREYHVGEAPVGKCPLHGPPKPAAHPKPAAGSPGDSGETPTSPEPE